MISIDGFLAVYFSMRNPTAEDRQGARPPAVRMATFAYRVVVWRVWGWGGVGSAAAAWAGRDGADLGAHLPAFRRKRNGCMRRPSHALTDASSAGTCDGAVRAVPLTRSGRG